MSEKPKKKFSFFKLIIGILAVLGVIFIILLLWPMDEDSYDNEGYEVSSEETAGEGPGLDLTGEESGLEPSEGEGTDPDSAGSEGEDSASDHEGNEGGSDQGNSGAASSENMFSDEIQDPVYVGNGAESATVMIYMNGSDLESEGGQASYDISEMISSGIGNNVNVIIQTMGTREWQDYDISSDTAQTYKIEDGKLKLVRDELGQLDCTETGTLSEFVGFCKSEYPADRYMFIFWDHGGGPVYGFGYNEWGNYDDSLTIAEMREAFSEHKDIRFDIIGMDCCIMGSIETCYALAPFCDYTVLSEDFEAGTGWYYTDWMKQFEKAPGISSPILGKSIVDSVVDDNENSLDGEPACMTLFKEYAVNDLFKSWITYAYQNEEALLNTNYSRKHRAKRGGRERWSYWAEDESDVTISDYYISDMLALVEDVDKKSDAAKDLISKLKTCVAYYRHTSDKDELTGVAVSLPYGDEEFYGELKKVYSKVNLDSDYIDWLKNFVSSGGDNEYYDYGEFENSWGGWGDYSNEYEDQNSDDEWTYDYDTDMWYVYEDGCLYMYDEETEIIYCYDEYEDKMYYYDEKNDDWYETEM